MRAPPFLHSCIVGQTALFGSPASFGRGPDVLGIDIATFSSFFSTFFDGEVDRRGTAVGFLLAVAVSREQPLSNL